MINQETITLHLRNYYVPSYTGVDLVAITRILNDGRALVEAGGDTRPFVIPVEYIFTDQVAAAKARRNWEHWKRAYKREQAAKRKAARNESSGTA